MWPGFEAKLFAGTVIQAHDLTANLCALRNSRAPRHADVVLDAVGVGVLPGALFIVESDHGSGDRSGFGERAHDEEVVPVVVAVHVGEYCGHDFCAESGHGSTVARDEKWCLRGPEVKSWRQVGVEVVYFPYAVYTVYTSSTVLRRALELIEELTARPDGIR